MTARYLETRELPITDLQRLPGNPRRGNTEEIRKSIRRHGQYRALVTRQHDGHLTVLAGNHTRDALEAEGAETARCEIITCTDDEARRINLSDNRLSDIAGDDLGELAALLAALDGDYDGTGWAEDAAAAVLAGDDDSPGPGGAGPPDSADLPNDGEDKYREQYGVIVICDSETDQQQAYEHLQGFGYNVKVVTT